MKILTLVILLAAIAALGSGAIIYVANNIPHTSIASVSSWIYPDNHQISLGGNITTGKTIRIYTEVNNLDNTTKKATISISYKPRGGSWTTEKASYNKTLNYWYVDWLIPADAVKGLYDVMVDVSTTDKMPTTSTISNAFNVAANTNPTIGNLSLWVSPDNHWIDKGGNVSTWKTISIYAQASDKETASEDLVVDISYRPQGGNWTTPAASYNKTLDSWYANWVIPKDAGLGLYDVRVYVNDGTGGSATSIITGQFIVSANPKPIIVYVSSWIDPANQLLQQGGNVLYGETIRLYTQISDANTASKNLKVNISYRPQGGSWTTPVASYDPTYDYWYVDWSIPLNATAGLYDVKVDVTNGAGVSSTSTIVGRFNMVVNPNPTIVYISSWVDPENQLLQQGGNVSTGKVLRMYTEVLDAKTASKNLTVNISYMPQGGSWITPVASYDPTYNYWYVDWSIPFNATTGTYNVKVDASTPDHRSTTNTTLYAFNVHAKPTTLVIWDDGASFWKASSGGTGGIDIAVAQENTTVRSGANSLKYQIVSGTKAFVSISHSYTSPKDWSDYNNLEILWYGKNTGATMDIYIYAPDFNNRFTGHFIDNFNGWRKVALPVSSFASTGSPNWWNVDSIQIATAAKTTTTWYLDATTMAPPTVLMVWDDGASFWTPSSGGTGSIDIAIAQENTIVHSGANSLKYQIVAGTKAFVSISHSYASPQDWSGYNSLSLLWYGKNTGATMDIYILGLDFNNRFTSHFIDNFNGWRKVALLVSNFTSTGSPSWLSVGGIQIATTTKIPTTWYLDATTMEPPKPTLVVWDDGASFWKASSGGAGNIDIIVASENTTVHSGANSLKYQIVTGTKAWVAISHSYASPQDWSGYNTLAIWWYGKNTGATMDIYVYAPDFNNRFTGHFIDNFNGWRWEGLSISGFTGTGSPSWWSVGSIQIATTAKTPTIWYLDLTNLEVP